MLIDRDMCLGCGECRPYCIVGAISIKDEEAYIDQDECLECGSCLRTKACPVNAIYMPTLEWPRVLREQFSNPVARHPKTKMGGRGTEEVKTNEVTGRIQCGQIGIAVEMGRPGIGTTFREVEKVSRALSPLGVEWEKANPLTTLFDLETGVFREDVLDERVLSCILECIIPRKKVEKVLSVLQKVAPTLDTVFSLGFVSTYAPDGTLPGLDIVRLLGYEPRSNYKFNLGMGRPLFVENNGVNREVGPDDTYSA